MTTKEIITSIAEHLDGVTLQLCSKHNVIPYNNVPEFLAAFEDEERYGNDVFITQVWLQDNKVQRIDNDQEVLKLLGEITAIQFTSKKIAKTESEAINYIMHG